MVNQQLLSAFGLQLYLTSYQLPQHNPGRYRNVQGMLHPQLRDLDAPIA
jgi:hypothetical protein